MRINSEERLINTLQDENLKIINIGYTTQSLPLLDKAKNLRKLLVSSNELKALPSLDKLTNLRDLWAYRNELKALPSLNNLTSLQYLGVRNNELKALPSLDNLTSLQYLLVYNNELKALPEHISLIPCKNTYSNKYPKWLNYQILIK